MGIGGQRGLAVVEHGAHAGDGAGLQVHDAQIGHVRLSEDDAGDGEHGGGDDESRSVGQDVAEDDPPVLGAQRPGRQHVLLALEAVKLRPDRGGLPDPVEEHEREKQRHDHAQLLGEVDLEQAHEHHRGDLPQDVLDPLEDQVEPAAVIALQCAHNDADAQRDGGHQYAQHQAQPGAQRQPGEDVVAIGVRAEQERRVVPVQIPIPRRIQHPALDLGAVHFGDGIQWLAVFVPQVDILQLAVLIPLGHALAVGQIPAVGVALVDLVGDLAVVDDGIEKLDPLLLLIGPGGLILPAGEQHGHIAHLGVGVDAQVIINVLPPRVHHLLVGLRALHDGAGDRVVVIIGLLVGRDVGAAVPEVQPQPHKEAVFGQRVAVIAVVIAAAVMGDLRADGGIDGQDQQHHGADHAALVPGEAAHGVPEVAHRLGIQLFVVYLLAALHQGKAAVVHIHIGGELFRLIAHWSCLLPYGCAGR